MRRALDLIWQGNRLSIALGIHLICDQQQLFTIYSDF